MDYYVKYNKYKKKYINLKNQIGGQLFKDTNNYLFFLEKNQPLIDKMKISVEKNTYIQLEDIDLICPHIEFKNFKIINKFNGSNIVYQVEIDKETSYITDNIYLDGNIDTLALKICDLDNSTCTFHIYKEIDAIIKFSKLVVNKICNSYMLFLGFTNNCCINIAKDSNIENKNDIDICCTESILITNFIKDSEHIRDIDDRQLFEYLYCIICCIANYNIVIGDQHSDNYLSYNDTSGIIYEIFDSKIYFNTTKAICIIDYQSINEPIQCDESKYNITKECLFIKSYCKNPDTLEKLTKQLEIGTIEELLNSLITNFIKYNYVDAEPEIKTFKYAVLP